MNLLWQSPPQAGLLRLELLEKKQKGFLPGEKKRLVVLRCRGWSFGENGECSSRLLQEKQKEMSRGFALLDFLFSWVCVCFAKIAFNVAFNALGPLGP